MKKTRRQLEEDLRQAEQDLEEVRREAHVATTAASMIYTEVRALRRETDAWRNWARSLKRLMEKDVIPEGLL